MRPADVLFQVAAAGFFRGQLCRPGLGVGHARPDVKHYVDQEQKQLETASGMLVRHRARPSLMQVQETILNLLNQHVADI